MDVTIFLAPSSKRLFMGIAEHFEKSQLFEFWPFLFGSGLARLGLDSIKYWISAPKILDSPY
jgi:hypothetical protein